MDWIEEMNKMHNGFESQTLSSLSIIKMAFKQNGMSFNRKFREYFLKKSIIRIACAYDQFEIDSMLEEEVNHTEANVSTVQSVDALELGLVIEPHGHPKQLNHPIEIDDSSDEETFHIKSETSEGVANNLNGATINDTAGQLTSSLQIYESGDDEMASVQHLHTTANQTRANQVSKGGNRSEVLNDQTKSGENGQYKGGNDDGISIKPEEGIKPKKPKIDDDVPVVLVEINRMVNASIANVAGIDSNKAIKKNNDTNDDGGQKDGNSLSALTKEVPSVDPSAKRPITSKSKPIHKSNGDKTAPKRSKPKKRFRCTVCEYSSNWKANLKIHMRIHTGEKPHRCDRCGKRFSEAQNLKKHAVTHTDDFPFHCFGCFRGFSQKAEKEAHDKVCRARRYECHICKKFVAFDKTRLIRHMRSHTGKKPFRCEICLKRFTEKGNLKAHLENIHGKIH